MGQRERISITRVRETQLEHLMRTMEQASSSDGNRLKLAVEFLRYYDGQKVRDVELQARQVPWFRKMVSQGVRREDIAEKLGISIRTVYRLA